LSILSYLLQNFKEYCKLKDMQKESKRTAQ